MVEFNRLIVLPKYQGIYLDVQVPDIPYYENIYIDRVVIDTQDTYTNCGISSKPVYEYKVDGDVKSLQLTISDSDILVPCMAGQLFFVYVVTKGTFAPDTPQGCDCHTTLAACADTYRIYRQGTKYMAETYKECEVPRHFLDFILRYNAFKIAMKTRDYPLAIAYWEKFNKQMCYKSSSNCGCNG